MDRAADALDEADTVHVVRAGRRFIGGLEAPARAAELRSAGLSVVALPETATGVKPPLLLPARGSSYTLHLADGRELSGGAREIAEALGER